MTHCYGRPASGDHLVVVAHAQVDRAVIDQNLLAQLRQIGALLRCQLALGVPVRHLDADEHAGHDDEKVDADGEPVLVLYVLHDAAENHCLASSSFCWICCTRSLMRVRQTSAMLCPNINCSAASLKDWFATIVSKS